MAKKMLKKQRIVIQKLEERVLFDAAGAVEIVDAAAAAAAVENADAVEAESSESAEDESAVMTAPPEDAAKSQEAADKAAAETGAEAAENADSSDEGFEQGFEDNTALAEELAEAVEDIEVEDLDDIMAEDSQAEEDIEVDAGANDDVPEAAAEAESEEPVVFADAFAVEDEPVAEERELVIISDYIKDKQEIISQLDENTDVLILEADGNPLDQINEYLDSRDNVKYDAIHVVSHGNAGYFLLNDSIVDAQAVAQDPASWKAIGEHLADDGDIMIYGCNVAGSEDGKAMIANIAELTGADVAASVDKVGSANGWELEYSYGIVDTQNIVINGMDYSLGSYTVYFANEGQDTTFWDTHVIAEGTESLGEGVTAARGQLLSFTTTDDVNTYTVVENSGDWAWCLTQAGNTAGGDIITISSGLAEQTFVIEADHMTAVNQGLTIHAEGSTITVENGGTGVSGNLEIFDAGAVNVTDNLYITTNGSFTAGATGDIVFGVENGTLGSVSVAAGAGSFSVNSSGGDVKFYGNLDDRSLYSEAGTTINITGNSVSFAHDIWVEGDVYIDGDSEATTAAVTFNGAVTVWNSGSLLDVSGYNITFEVDGDAALDVNGIINITAVNNLTINSPFDLDSGGDNSLSAGGTLELNGATTTYGNLSLFYGTLNQNGNLTVESGTLTLTGDVTFTDIAVEIKQNGTLQLADGITVTFSEDTGDTALTLGGTISGGAGTTLVFDESLEADDLTGSNTGWIEMGEGTVRYGFALDTNSLASIYRGNYQTLGVMLAQNSNLNDSFFGSSNHNVEKFLVGGTNVTVDMLGAFDNVTATVDYEAGSSVTFSYAASSIQYILGGYYKSLSVTGSNERYLAGDVYVGVGDTNHGNHNTVYSGNMVLGTTLKTAGHNITFYSGTQNAAAPGRIDASGGGAVTYYTTREHNKQFYAGTYQNVTIASVPYVFQNPDHGLTYEVDVGDEAEITINGTLTVRAGDSEDTEIAGIPVTVNPFDFKVTFQSAVNRVNRIVVQDAQLVFTDNVLGNISGGISVTRSANYEGGLTNDFDLEGVDEAHQMIGIFFQGITDGGSLGNIGDITLDGAIGYFGRDTGNIGEVSVTGTNAYFAGSIENMTSLALSKRSELINGVTHYTSSTVTFADSVNFTNGSIESDGGDIFFNGATTGNASIRDLTGSVTYNFNGNQNIYTGLYNNLTISGSGIKTIDSYGTSFELAGEGTLSNTTMVGGVFNGNTSQITIDSGTFRFSNLAAGTANAPAFTVDEDATLHFANANTGAMTFYGSIDTYGTVDFSGRISTTGTLTVRSTGNLLVQEAAANSSFEEIINEGNINLDKQLTVDLIHNYGTLTVTDNQATFDIYNHSTGHLIFNLTKGGNNNQFTFSGGEGTINDENETNELVNGGQITVQAGHLLLNGFTQGDKDRVNATWTYDVLNAAPVDENYVYTVGNGATLTLATAAFNTGNINPPGGGALLGSISNSGTFNININTAVTLNGNVANSGKIELANNAVTFKGSFEHNGSLHSAANSTNAELTFRGAVRGNGTISSGNGGAYAGRVYYVGSDNQRIFNGSYANAVELTGGTKYINGDVVFNDALTSSAELTGSGKVTFNGTTDGVSSSVGNVNTSGGTLNAVYGNNAGTIFAGSYGDLEIQSTTTAREIEVNLTVNNLTLSGTNTFTDAEDAELNVAETITFATGSVTTFNRALTGNAELTGGSNGMVTFAEQVSGTVKNLSANVIYSSTGTGENAQNILSGTYQQLTLNGGEKVISGNIQVNNSLEADSGRITVGNGAAFTVTGTASIADILVTESSTLSLIGTITVDNVEISAGSTMNVTYLAGNTHRLGTDDAVGAVTLGGTLNIYAENGTDTDDYITIYRWVDLTDPETGIATGDINIDGANVEFATDADTYGYVNANLVTINMQDGYNGGQPLDAGNRLQNLWITIDGTVQANQLTSDLMYNYNANSKFLLINGVHLTVDSLRSGDNTFESIAAIRLTGGSVLDITGGLTVGDLTVEANSEVIFNQDNDVETLIVNGIAELSDGERQGEVTTPTYAIRGNGNVTFTGAGTGEGAAVNRGSGTLNMTGGTVSYVAGLAVYGGIYQELTLAGNTVSTAVTVNGAATVNGTSTFGENSSATLNGTVTVAANQTLTFTGAVAGTGSVAAAAASSVVYNSNTAPQYILGGNYVNLTLETASGTADAAKTYSLAANMTVSGTTTLQQYTVLNAAGTEETPVTVTFNASAGSVIEGTSYLGTVAFGEHTTAVYQANDSTVFAGTYENITFTGGTADAEKTYTAGGDITVNGNAYLQQYSNFEATGADGNVISISFIGTTGDPEDPEAETGNVDFGANTDVYYSSSANVIAGTYAGLTLEGDHSITGNITVTGEACFTGGVISGTGDWTFSGSRADASTSTFANTGKVIYNGEFTGNAFAGEYQDLEVSNNTDGVVSFSGSVSVTNELSGTGHARFTSQVTGGGTVVGDAENSGTLSVTYDWGTGEDLAANYILAGTYANLTLVGHAANFTAGSDARHNYSYTGHGTYRLVEGTTTVTGSFTLQKYAQLTSDNDTEATLSLKGSTNAVFSESAMPAAPEGQQPPSGASVFQPYNPYVGTMNMGSNSTVEYDASAAVFAGTYGNLTLNGAHNLGVYDITVNGTADFDGEVSGSGKWTFNGTAQGGGSLNNAPGNDWYYSYPPERINPETGTAFTPRITIREMYSDAGIAVNRVVYGSNFNGNIFAGTYTDLQVDAAGTNEAVAGVITLNGVLSGSGNLTFTKTNIYGENARASHTGKVTYDSDSNNVLGGSYGNIVLNDTRTIEEDITVSGKATLNGIQMLADGVTVNFAGTTNAGELISNAGTTRIVSGSGATVTYGADADVFQGEYFNLTLAKGSIGNNQLGYGVQVDAEGNEVPNGTVHDTGHIIVRGEFNFSTHSVLAGNYSFTMEGTFGENVDDIRQTAGTLIYGAGADVLGGVYYNFTLTSGKDADNKLTYNALGDVTVNGHSNIGDYAIFAATGSSEITVNGTEFELESGRGYDRVWTDGNGNYVLYKNGRWELYEGNPSYGAYLLDYTVSSNIDPFGDGAVWSNGSTVTGNMITITFNGTTNAGKVGEVVQMGDYSATVYAASADQYKGSYFRFQVEGGDSDVRYSDLPEDVVVTDELIVDVHDNYYFVFDKSVAEDFDLSITIHGDIWYTNTYLGGDDANPGHQPLAGSFAGSVRLGGDYMADHSYSGTYEGDVVLSGVTITGDNEYIDAKALRRTLTVENSNYSGANFRLLVSEIVDDRPGIEYKGDSTIMALYSSTDEDAEGIAYKELILDGNMNVAAGNTIEVVDKLDFRENATLTVIGNFILGSENAAGQLRADHTNILIASGTSEESVSLYLGDNAVLPVLYNAGLGSVNITAGNNITISSYGNTSSGASIENIGTINISVGDNLLINGVVIDGGNLNITAGNNALLAGTALVTGDTGNTVITLGADAKIKSDILVSGSLAMTVVQGQFSGSGILVTGNGNFDLTLGTADSRPSTIANEILIDGGNASMTISGYHQTYSGMVRVHGGTLTITGSDIGFIDDVLNYDVGSIGSGTTSGTGYKWIHDYLANDAQYYSYYQGAKAVPGAANNPGRIVIDSGAGKVSFSALVVSGGEFDINSGIVTFNSDFAVSDGTFSITGGEVMFKSDVYVSAVYTGSTAGTHFTVSGGKVTMAGSLYNWVRIPVYYFGTDEKVPQFNGPFWKDADGKIHLDDSTGNSHIEFKGDASVTINRNMSNIGIWGDVSISIMENANVTVKGNFANFGEALSAFWGSGNDAKYDYVTQLMGFSSGFTAGGTTHPLKPDFLPGSSITEFILDDNGKLNVIGETLNGAIYHNGTAWGKNTSGGLGYATFTINSNGNNFTGLFTNSSHFDINGSGNTFGDVHSRYFMTVTATNSFGTITNYHDLQIMNPKAVVLSLVNNGGNVWISGEADGFAFKNELTVNGGNVWIESEFGVDIASDVTVKNGGDLTFAAANVISGEVKVDDGTLTFNDEAGGSVLESTVWVGENGNLNISTDENGSIRFEDTVSNEGTFLVDGSVEVVETVENSGKLTVSKQSVFSGTLNNTGEVLIASSAVGTTFSNIYNSGKFTNSSTGISQITDKNYRFENQAGGSFINNTGAEATFEAFTNSGMMKIDGTLTVNGNFINDGSGKDNGVYIYGVADFNRTGGETYNSGTIYLEPITGDHEAAVKFGTITNDGVITSLNDSRNAGDIYFGGETFGSGSIEGFTGSLYYVYTGTDKITQSFYSNSKYDQVTVYVGNKSVTGLDYSNGLVTMTENIAFKSLNIDGGNLAIGDASHNIVLDAGAFTEITPGTITVNAGSVLAFSNAEGTEFSSSIANNGMIFASGDLVLNGTTAGNGQVNLAQGKSITYSYNGTDEQVLFGFAEGSATNLVVSGSTKVIATDMTIESLTNNQLVDPADDSVLSAGADIKVKNGVTLTLNRVVGTATEYDLVTEQNATLNVVSDGELIAGFDNAGTVNLSAASGKTLTASGNIDNKSGAVFNAAAAAGASLALTGNVINSGSFNASGVSGNVSVTSVSNNGGTASFTNASAGSITNDKGSVTLTGTTASSITNNSGDVTLTGSSAAFVSNTGSLTADNSSFEIVTNAADAGVFNVNAGVVWNELYNYGTLNLNADTTIGSENAISTNTGTINVDGTLTVESAANLGGTVNVNAGAELKVTGNGAGFETVVNSGLVEVTGNGEMTIAKLNNGEQGAASTLKASGNGVATVTDSINAEGEVIDTIYGKIVKLDDGKIIYNNGKIDNMVVVANDGTLSEAIEGFDQGNINNLEISVSGQGRFTIDVDSDENISYSVTDNAELKIDQDGTKDSGSLQIEGDINAGEDTTVTVENPDSVVFTKDSELTVEGTFVNDGAEVRIYNTDGNIANLENSGKFITKSDLGNVENTGSIQTSADIDSVESNTGDIEQTGTDDTIGSIESNEGTITTAGSIDSVGNNSGTVEADTVGTVSGNSGTVTAGTVENVESNSGSGKIEADTVGTVGGNEGTVTAGSIDSVGNNSGTIEAQNIGSVNNNDGVISQNGDGGSLGNVETNAGTIVVNGNNTVAGDIEDNSGSIEFNGQNIQAGDINNGKAGSVTVNGSVSAEDVSNAGDFVVSANGSFSADSMDNSGDFIDNGSSSIGSMNNSGDVTVKGSGSIYDSVDNSGSISLGGSGNSIGKLDNTGLVDISASGSVGRIENSGTGSIYRDGVIWMMATDEGMNPEFYSDGTNKNFSVLSHLTDMLDADTLEAGFVSTFDRLMPGRYLSDSHVRHADLHAALEHNTDLLNIDDAVDELIHGSAPELDEEEILDILSGNESYQDEFDAAVNEVIEE